MFSTLKQKSRKKSIVSWWESNTATYGNGVQRGAAVAPERKCLGNYLLYMLLSPMGQTYPTTHDDNLLLRLVAVLCFS